ncbi:MAG TPA: NADP-dependent oxidoreductase, partial [Caldilineaceae bacterium]|nr:NADP-dependent oxidoreductase [Caldilineaceae bacterium]
MQAIRVHRYGGPEVLTLERIPRPEPRADELLIRIIAAGVLPADCRVRNGFFRQVMPAVFPYIPGTAFAGVVERAGAAVAAFAPGQAVCGRSPNGTYAEFTTVRADAPPPAGGFTDYRQANANTLLIHKPETITFDEAATLSGGATTAWTALFEDGDVQPGQRVLIHGAAGGVGLFAVQFARWRGAEVIGTASTGNIEFVRSLGADTVIDYTTTPFDEAVREVDFVLDTIGGETLRRSMRILRPGGTLVSLVEEPPAALAEQLGVRAFKNATIPTSAHLRAIAQLIDAGHARPVVQQTFALDEAAAAHALCETGHGRGRIV